MKKLLVAGAISMMLTACAGLLGGNPQITALADTSSRIVNSFANALEQTVESYSLTLEAVGNKTAAETLKSEVGNLRDEEGTEKMEAGIGTLNEVDLGAELEKAGELSEEGKKQVTKAMLHLGIAIFFDAKVAIDAVDLVKEAKDVLQNLSPADAMYAGDINQIISNASFIADVAPDQLSGLKSTFDSLKAYADAHGIEVPSQADIEQQAGEMERE